MCHALEKRGYVKAGPWTPKCTVEHPEAGEKMAQSPCSKTISSKFIDSLSLVKCGSLAGKEKMAYSLNQDLINLTWPIILNDVTLP